MLKKSERLGRAAFSHYFKVGKRTHSPHLTSISSPAAEFLCSVVVSKKVSKAAPTRNTIRRRLYAVVGQIKKEKSLTGVYIFITKPEIAKLSRKDFLLALEAEVGRVLN